MTLHHFLRTLLVAAVGIIGLAFATHARAEGGEGASVVLPEKERAEEVRNETPTDAPPAEGAVAEAAESGTGVLKKVVAKPAAKGGVATAASKPAASAGGQADPEDALNVEQTSSLGTVQEVAKTRSQQADAIRSASLRPLILRYASEHGLPVELADAVVRIESRYNAGARNGPNMGLTQINYRSAQSLGYRGEASGLLDPETNLRYGLKYLAQAYKLAKGDTCGTILRYQAGHRAQAMTGAARAYCARVKTLMAAAD